MFFQRRIVTSIHIILFIFWYSDAMTVLCGCVYGVSHTTRRSLVRSQFFVQLLKIFKHGSEVPRSNKMLHTHVTFLFARVPAIIRTYTHTEFQIAGCLDMSDCEKLYQSLFPTELFLLFRFVQEDIGLIMINLWLFLLSNPLPSCWYPALQISKKTCA